ncbi:hypothetical protein [Corallococcus aberystwythensis]|uniref:Lipoprotein n=1 Tax=Corallococcus aberystwythensis TaxID=2316722 RepID=A0A3A8PZA6_9BACT|nr:hypothetical protein [Corallococcus aberystwythensis]RKH56564.1 hypothetical protein D7W81_33485 [Corallococcus aberystwythensis]
MKKILFGLAAMASLTLTACGGGSICDQLEDVSKESADKAEECGLTIDADDKEVTDAEREQCETATESCSDADKEAFEKYADCVADVKGCADKSEAEQQAFALRVFACASNLTSVSAACNAAAGE